MPAAEGWPAILAKAGPTQFSNTSRALPIRQCFSGILPVLPPWPSFLHGFTRAAPEISHVRRRGWIELS
jgi:hypothetical protein